MSDPVPPTPVVAKPTWDLNDVVRAAVILIALGAVTAALFVGDSTTRPQALTALITLLAAAAGYLFRGRVTTTDTTTPVVTNVANVR